MQPIFDRADRSGLLANTLGALAFVVVIDGLIFGLGRQQNPVHAPSFLPAPIVIALVWLVLFPCMGVARWELNRGDATRGDKAGITTLFALCAAYPLYTVGLENNLIGDAAAIALLVLAVSLALRYGRIGSAAATWLVPLVLWLGFASTALTITLLHGG